MARSRPGCLGAPHAECLLGFRVGINPGPLGPCSSIPTVQFRDRRLKACTPSRHSKRDAISIRNQEPQPFAKPPGDDPVVTAVFQFLAKELPAVDNQTTSLCDAWSRLAKACQGQQGSARPSASATAEPAPQGSCPGTMSNLNLELQPSTEAPIVSLFQKDRCDQGTSLQRQWLATKSCCTKMMFLP